MTGMGVTSRIRAGYGGAGMIGTGTRCSGVCLPVREGASAALSVAV